jgi:hypothetical protein
MAAIASRVAIAGFDTGAAGIPGMASGVRQQTGAFISA